MAWRTGKEIVDLARFGNTLARAALERYANRLAGSLAHVTNILNPDVIVLGREMHTPIEKYRSTVPA